MNNATFQIIYRLLQKAITANTMASMAGYIAEAMTVIEKTMKKNS